jgi:GNAT superfamily N-acetyltransferase
MGARGEDAAQLTDKPGGSAAGRRGWPLVVRRARASDEAAVMSFASATWDGWDYIPRAWPVWLAESDGVLLVGCRPDDDRPVAVSRVAMLTPTEAWLEGIRVDPEMRGLEVATDLQVAELSWAAAMGATVIRYATGAENQGSHRLGARHGFRLAAEFTAVWHSPDPDNDPDSPSAYDETVRAAATAKRRNVLAAVAREGLIARETDTARLWSWLDGDPTFAAAQRLYEKRPWAMQELTAIEFAGHVQRGEVLVADSGGERALAILPGEQQPAEDSSLRLAVLIGDAHAAVALLDAVRQAARGETPRVRVPVDAPLLAGNKEVFAAAGYRSPAWLLHLLTRPLDAANPVPAADPARLTLVDAPGPLGRRP